jgi:hypothetical protein
MWGGASGGVAYCVAVAIVHCLNFKLGVPTSKLMTKILRDSESRIYFWRHRTFFRETQNCRRREKPDNDHCYPHLPVQCCCCSSNSLNRHISIYTVSVYQQDSISSVTPP